MSNAKLTESIVREIRHLQATYRFGYTVIYDLLIERGRNVSLSGVRNVVRGNTWRHVLIVLVLLMGYGMFAQEPTETGTSDELGPTGPFGPITADESTTVRLRPDDISALENGVHDTTVEYLKQRGWLHNCDAPGGCWLWEKGISGKVYRVETDTAKNIEFYVQHLEELEALQYQVIR